MFRNKGAEVPTDPTKGVTDNVIFTINEEFAFQASVPRHIKTASGNDYFPKFAEVLGSSLGLHVPRSGESENRKCVSRSGSSAALAEAALRSGAVEFLRPC